MRICKVEGCNRKLYAKGYCIAHYDRKREGRTINPKCKWCKKYLPLPKREFCNQKCISKYYYHHKYKNNKKMIEKRKKYQKDNMTYINLMGKQFHVFTNGVTQEIKDKGIVKKLKDKVLKDCIKNPRKYLEVKNE